MQTNYHKATEKQKDAFHKKFEDCTCKWIYDEDYGTVAKINTAFGCPVCDPVNAPDNNCLCEKMVTVKSLQEKIPICPVHKKNHSPRSVSEDLKKAAMEHCKLIDRIVDNYFWGGPLDNKNA